MLNNIGIFYVIFKYSYLSSIKKLFDEIKNKLKKDEDFGMGVKGKLIIHRNYFYQKDLVGSKLFVTDMYNEKAPIIEIV